MLDQDLSAKDNYTNKKYISLFINHTRKQYSGGGGTGTKTQGLICETEILSGSNFP